MADIEIEGLAQLRRALKQIDGELPKELRDRFMPLAQSVAAGAASRVPSRTGATAASIRGSVSGNNVYVAGGKAAVPYYGWADFGSRTPVLGNPRSVGPWSGSGAGPGRGRFIYPEVDARRDDLEREAAAAVDSMADRLLPHQ